MTNVIFQFDKFNPDEMLFSFFYNIEDLISLVLDHRKPIVHVSNSAVSNSAKTYVLARSTGGQPPTSGGAPGDAAGGAADGAPSMTPGLSDHFFY